MHKYQVWVRGSRCIDIEAEDKKSALKYTREEILEVKRLPNGTTINEIPHDYYKQIVEMNSKAGFNATNY